MGLIKAALGAAGGVMADQWKEFFVCDSLPNDVLMRKGDQDTHKVHRQKGKHEHNFFF